MGSIPGRVGLMTQPVRITRGCLAALPSDLHRIFARKLIASGEWILVDDDQAYDRDVRTL